MKTESWMICLLGLVLGACSGGGSGGASSTPPADVDEYSISTMESISSVATDFCTQFTGDACYFGGGQIIKFTNGTVYITGGWRHVYINGADSDTFQSTITGWFPSSYAAPYAELSSFVARGSGLRKTWIVYNKTAGTLSLVYDADGDSIPTASDTTLTTLTTATM